MTNYQEIAELIIEKAAAELKGQSHLQEGRRISFNSNRFVLGRNLEGYHACGLSIPSMRISKHRHAEIVFEDDRYWLVRHTRNLIALNGRELERGQPYVLENEDSIVLAGVIKFQVALSAGDTWPVLPKGVWISTTPYPMVKVNGTPLKPPLSAEEFRFLELLYKNAGHTVSRDQIFDHVWPHEYATDSQLEHIVHRVRARLAEVDTYEFIVTQRRAGYWLQQPPLTLDNLLENNSFSPEAPRKVLAPQIA